MVVFSPWVKSYHDPKFLPRFSTVDLLYRGASRKKNWLRVPRCEKGCPTLRYIEVLHHQHFVGVGEHLVGVRQAFAGFADGQGFHLGAPGAKRDTIIADVTH